MTARSVIRHAVPPIGVILVALAVAAAILLASRAGIAGPPDGAVDPSMGLEVPARAAPGPAVAIAPDRPAPASVAADPQVDDVRQLWRRGEYVAAGVLGLFLLLAAALRIDRRRAFFYTGGLTALAGCADLAANGQTPSSGMLIGAVAVFVGIVTRSPLPAAMAQRPPERGFAAGPLLAILVGAALTVGAMSAWSCSGAKRAAAVVKDAVVDCSKLTAEAHVAEYADRIERAVLAGTDKDGNVSWAPAKREIAAILADAGLEVAGCAGATAVARLLSFAPRPVGVVATPEPSRAQVLDGWQATRAELFGGRRFAVAVEGL